MLRWTPLLVLALAASAGAGGLNRSYLVPVYDACPGTGNCPNPSRSSPFTFDEAALYSSAKPYTAPKKVALIVAVKGVKDGTGAPFTGTLVVKVPAGRTTILGSVGTLGEASPLIGDTVYPVVVKNGDGRGRFMTPPETPASGLVVNTFEAPVLYDPDGKPLASTGTRTKN